MPTTYISPVMVDGGCRGSSYKPKEHKQNVENVEPVSLFRSRSLFRNKLCEFQAESVGPFSFLSGIPVIENRKRRASSVPNPVINF